MSEGAPLVLSGALQGKPQAQAVAASMEVLLSAVDADNDADDIDALWRVLRHRRAGGQGQLQDGQGGRAKGGLFSLDGVHPTTVAYGIVAQELITIMQSAGVTFRTPTGAVL